MKLFGVVLPLLILNPSAMFAQELQKKISYSNRPVKQEFYVLKINKKIKHGQFISSYKHSIYKRQLVELGQYQNNQKDGSWLSFYYLPAENPLKSIGSFQKNKKIGYWIYFYPFVRDTLNKELFNESKIYKKTKYVGEDKLNQTFNVALDTSGIIPLCHGYYENDKKVGIWDYFSTTGKKTHIYDHSTDSLIYQLHQQDSLPFLYLGGFERFGIIFNTIILENGLLPLTAECKYKISAPGQYIQVGCTGDENLKRKSQYLLSQIPPEWIVNRKSVKKNLYLTSKFFLRFDDSIQRLTASYSNSFEVE